MGIEDVGGKVDGNEPTAADTLLATLSTNNYPSAVTGIANNFETLENSEQQIFVEMVDELLARDGQVGIKKPGKLVARLLGILTLGAVSGAVSPHGLQGLGKAAINGSVPESKQSGLTVIQRNALNFLKTELQKRMSK